MFRHCIKFFLPKFVRLFKNEIRKKLDESVRLFVFTPELGVVFDLFFVIDWIKIALVVHAEKGGFIVFYVVNEENAVEMVDFVKKSSSKRVFGFDADGGSVFEEGLDFDLFRTRDEAVNRRDRETTFIVFFGLAFGFDDFWVNKSGKIGVFLIFEIVANDNDAAVKTELGSGHGGRKFVWMVFFPCQRSLAHFSDDIKSFVGDMIDFFAPLTKPRIGRRYNFHKYNFIIIVMGGQLRYDIRALDQETRGGL